MTIIYRDVKGANLTPAEVDGNFHDLDDRVDGLENNPPEARSIAEITQSGDGGSLTIEYTDSTTDGPFTLPAVNLRFRGEWAPITSYLINDIITAEGAVYLVIFDHTSEASFDPGANNGSGDDFYGLLLEQPDITIPIGGGERYVLSKASAADHDMQWNPGLPEGGLTGEVLTKVSDDDDDFAWGNLGSLVALPVTINTTTLTIDSESYINTFLRFTNGAGCLVTIPTNESLPLDIGVEIHFRQCSTGPVVLVGEDDSDGNMVVLSAITGFEPATNLTGAVMTAKKVSENSWDVWGLLTAEDSSDTA